MDFYLKIFMLFACKIGLPEPTDKQFNRRQRFKSSPIPRENSGPGNTGYKPEKVQPSRKRKKSCFQGLSEILRLGCSLNSPNRNLTVTTGKGHMRDEYYIITLLSH